MIPVLFHAKTVLSHFAILVHNQFNKTDKSHAVSFGVTRAYLHRLIGNLYTVILPAPSPETARLQTRLSTCHHYLTSPLPLSSAHHQRLFCNLKGLERGGVRAF